MTSVIKTVLLLASLSLGGVSFGQTTSVMPPVSVGSSELRVGINLTSVSPGYGFLDSGEADISKGLCVTAGHLFATRHHDWKLRVGLAYDYLEGSSYGSVGGIGARVFESFTFQKHTIHLQLSSIVQLGQYNELEIGLASGIAAGGEVQGRFYGYKYNATVPTTYYDKLYDVMRPGFFNFQLGFTQEVFTNWKRSFLVSYLMAIPVLEWKALEGLQTTRHYLTLGYRLNHFKK